MSTRQQGFTLIELIVALTVSVVVVGFVAMFMTVPAQANLAQARRAELAASAEAVTQSMSQDVRSALPNSVRAATIAGRPSVEMVDFTTAAIYRNAGNEGDPLVLNPALPADTRFDVLGAPGNGAISVVINNLGIAGRNAYALANVIAPAQINASTIQLNNAAFRFPAHSGNRRVFMVAPATAVIRYECDLVARELRRYDSRPMTAAMAAMPAGTPFRTIARDVTACTFTPQLAPPAPNPPEHGGTLLVRLTISRVTNGVTENLRVMKQLKVEEPA